jgi:hypothetical protein
MRPANGDGSKLALETTPSGKAKSWKNSITQNRSENSPLIRCQPPHSVRESRSITECARSNLSDMSPVGTRWQPPHSCVRGALQRSDTASPITTRFCAWLFLANSKSTHCPFAHVSDFPPVDSRPLPSDSRKSTRAAEPSTSPMNRLYH